MRYLLILFMMLTGLLSCTSQSKPATFDIPAAPQTAFGQRFPGAADIAWRTEGELFVVSFEVNDSMHEAWIDSTGNFLRLQYEIPAATLPGPVQAAISRDFGGHTLENSYLLDYSGIQAYLVTLVKDGARTDTAFMPDGSLIESKSK